jgi:hypothetical protein
VVIEDGLSRLSGLFLFDPHLRHIPRVALLESPARLTRPITVDNAQGCRSLNGAFRPIPGQGTMASPL